MYEVEVKVRADHDRVRDRLSVLDADHVGRVRQVDTYYDAPHREFAETDEALRLRRETPRDIATEGSDGDAAPESDGDTATDGHPAGDARAETRLTYKGPLVEAESKTREEHETDVGDGEEMDAALRALGFSPAATVRKERDRYALAEYVVTLDRVEGLGEFVEVEGEAPEDRIEPVREGAVALLERLGLDPNEGIRTSYLGLLLDARQ